MKVDFFESFKYTMMGLLLLVCVTAFILACIAEPAFPIFLVVLTILTAIVHKVRVRHAHITKDS